MQMSMTTPEENPSIPQSEIAPHVEPPPGKHIVTLLIDETTRTIELFQHLGGGRGRKSSVEYVKLKHGMKHVGKLICQMTQMQ